MLWGGLHCLFWLVDLLFCYAKGKNYYQFLGCCKYFIIQSQILSALNTSASPDTLFLNSVFSVISNSLFFITDGYMHFCANDHLVTERIVFNNSILIFKWIVPCPTAKAKAKPTNYCIIQQQCGFLHKLNLQLSKINLIQMQTNCTFFFLCFWFMMVNELLIVRKINT